jgi:hypothetical protein
MRKLIPFIMKLSVALIVLSVIGQQVTATKGDVERALELLKQARAAIGGETAINSIQNLSASGKSRKTLQLDQVEKELNGEFEMNMMLPDRFIKMEKLMMGTPGEGRAPAIEEDVKIIRPRVRVMRAGEGAEIGNAMRNHEHSELGRYMLGLLLTPPAAFNTTYNYLGEGDVSGTRADIIEARGANGFLLKIFLDKSSHLPLMMSYQGSLPRILLNKVVKHDGPATLEGNENEIIRLDEEDGATGDSPRIIVRRRIDGDKAPAGGDKFTLPAPAPMNAEIQVRFADFRTVNGVLLPHTMTQFVNGKIDSVWTVERYEVNSPNINDKFQKTIHFRAKHN